MGHGVFVYVEDVFGLALGVRIPICELVCVSLIYNPGTSRYTQQSRASHHQPKIYLFFFLRFVVCFNRLSKIQAL